MAADDSTNPIPPFPAGIDRFRFGDYLSGLVDGEGCFFLGMHNPDRSPHRGPSYHSRKTPTCRFSVTLRADDADILRLIQSFFGCGRLQNCKPQAKNVNHRPKLIYHVCSVVDAFGAIVPHFHAHPLRAKKSRDFVLWEKGVELAYRVSRRRKKGKGHAVGGRALGCHPRWRDAEVAEFGSLQDALRAARVYNSGAVRFPLPRPPVPEPPTLFDGLP